MSAETAIKIQNLGKSYALYRQRGDRLKQILRGRRRQYYEDFWALRDLSLEVKRGETLGIIGENGAGKSTLLQLICGTIRPTCGNIQIGGRVAALLELGAGFNPEFTGRENVILSAAVLGLSQAQIAERFDAIAEFAGIGEFMELPVKLYSSGMYARLAFSVCAHVDADILIVDEILAVGDTAFQQKCARYFNRFRERGTLLFVSHSSGMVANICERALWLEHGKLRELGPADEVCAHYLARETASAAQSKAMGSIRSQARGKQQPVIQDQRPLAANRIILEEFDPDAPWHGHGGAIIEMAGFYAWDGGGQKLTEIAGGGEVQLRVDCRAEREINRPVIGLILRDHLGQNIFGDNTYLAGCDTVQIVKEGEPISAAFRFQMPYLAKGTYSFTFAVTEGTQDDHIQLRWIEDALVMRVVESPVARGIVGLPAKDVRIDLVPRSMTG